MSVVGARSWRVSVAVAGRANHACSAPGTFGCRARIRNDNRHFGTRRIRQRSKRRCGRTHRRRSGRSPRSGCRRSSFDGLLARWSLGLVIVASNRLGVVNHTRLTIAAARTAGCAFAASSSTISRLERSTLCRRQRWADRRAEDIAVIEMPWLASPRDLTCAATQAEECGLISLLLSP